MIIVNTLKPEWPIEYIIYSATIPSAFTGADVAIFASVFAYISDITKVADRTLRITILDAIYLSTIPIGVALGTFFILQSSEFSIFRYFRSISLQFVQ